jgi:hypothetical protein
MNEARSVTSGVVFIASGAPYARAAVPAAESVRRTNPWLKVCLITDSPQDSPAFTDQVTFTGGHYRSKVDHLAATPYERTLYLDTDTRVVADLAPMFRLLEHYDIAMAHAHRRNRKATNETWKIDVPEAFPQLNGGVILYRNSEAMLAAMRQWSADFHTAGFQKDQVTIREILWQSDLRLYVLPPEYNIRYPRHLWFRRPSEFAPKILHMRKYHGNVKARGPLARLADLFGG